MNLEDEIKDKLGTKKCVKISGSSGGGCISSGHGYEIDDNRKIYVKMSNRDNAMEMFEGEMYSLQKIRETETIHVPDPICVVIDPTESSKCPGHGLVMEYLDLKPLSKYQSQLGTQLGRLHLFNSEQRTKYQYDSDYVGRHKNNEDTFVDKFGFDCIINCGHIPLVNEWHDDWICFFAQNRLDVQIRMIQSRTVDELWSVLQLKISKLFREFKDRDIKIVPSLLHGDLWSGNAAEIHGAEKVAEPTAEGMEVTSESVAAEKSAEDSDPDSGPVVFDPASFYGHSEFDLAIAEMFGGFRWPFYDSYFKVVKKVPGMESRMDLYQLFHYFNHWNHFGSGYSSKSINLMKKLISKL